jgi:hypothetical protein
MSNYTYHGTSNLIALPGRSVQTFPSGLVRVDRTYACQAADAGKYRQQFAVGNILPLDDGTPAIDGLYIFPDAQEEKSSDGFYRFKVSGYGRVNTTGTSQSLFEEGFATISTTSLLPPVTSSSSFTIGVINEVVLTSYVVPNTNDPIDNRPKRIPLRVFVGSPSGLIPIQDSGYNRSFTGFSNTLGEISTSSTVVIQTIIEDSPGIVFGVWKEAVYRLRANATISSITQQTGG